VSHARRTIALGLALLVALVTLATPVAAQVYRWTDDRGDIYLTTDERRIPAQYRDRVQVLESSPREPADGTDEASSGPRSSDTVIVEPGTPIIAEAHVNGVAARLLVDTGATRTLIATAILSQAGIDVTQGRAVGIRGVGGAVTAIEVTVPRLDVAGTQVGPLTVIAHDVPGLEADGLLGRDVLAEFTLVVDRGRRRATLTR
jgi:predicted aspartyl protease